MPRKFHGVADLAAAVGADLGHSTWRRVDQSVISAFAEVTGDRQWIHVDPKRAAAGPFGRTIAHGYYLLSALSDMLAELYTVDGAGVVINTGVDRLRFHRPVPEGSLIRAGARLAEVRPRRRGVADVTVEASVFVAGVAEPVCTATVRSMVRPPMARPGPAAQPATTGSH